jgi:hypothetical protein
MKFDITNDRSFGEIERDVVTNKGLLKDAWVRYEGEDWHPIIIKDRRTGVRGYEVNLTGKWGKNINVKRQKITLKDFLVGIADGTFPVVAAVRCKCLAKKDRNGRDLENLEMSERLRGLIARYQSKNADLSTDTLSHQTLSIVSKPEGSEDLNTSDPTSQGYVSDPVLRRVIEQYAVAKAIKHYAENGYKVTELGKPYDLLCVRDQHAVHVEVKGSRSILNAVILTVNEVKDARVQSWQSDLFIDCIKTPDLFQTYAVTSAALKLNVHFSGLQSLRLKETDRIWAVCNELSKMEVAFEHPAAHEVIINSQNFRFDQPYSIETYDDHRMAMAFTPLVLKIPSLIIQHPNVVKKSYPTFWVDIQKVLKTLSNSTFQC